MVKLSSLLREAKKQYIQNIESVGKTVKKEHIAVITRFIAFILTEYSSDVYKLDNRSQNNYLRGFFHGMIIAFFVVKFLT